MFKILVGDQSWENEDSVKLAKQVVAECNSESAVVGFIVKDGPKLLTRSASTQEELPMALNQLYDVLVELTDVESLNCEECPFKEECPAVN